MLDTLSGMQKPDFSLDFRFKCSWEAPIVTQFGSCFPLPSAASVACHRVSLLVGPDLKWHCETNTDTHTHRIFIGEGKAFIENGTTF